MLLCWSPLRTACGMREGAPCADSVAPPLLSAISQCHFLPQAVVRQLLAQAGPAVALHATGQLTNGAEFLTVQSRYSISHIYSTSLNKSFYLCVASCTEPTRVFAHLLVESAEVKEGLLPCKIICCCHLALLLLCCQPYGWRWLWQQELLRLKWHGLRLLLQMVLVLLMACWVPQAWALSGRSLPGRRVQQPAVRPFALGSSARPEP